MKRFPSFLLSIFIAVSLIRSSLLSVKATLISFQLITSENFNRLSPIAQIGRRYIRTIHISPSGDTIAVSGTLGVWLYSETLSEHSQNFSLQNTPVMDFSPNGMCQGLGNNLVKKIKMDLPLLLDG